MSKMIYQHFSKSDSSFIDKGLEWIKKVDSTYSPFVTPFVNPHQEKILKVLASTNNVSYLSSRQFIETEYVRVLLYPDYFEPEFSDFELSLQEIIYPNKFEKLTHSKILGTVLHQLGIDRKLFGDVLIKEERAQIIINRQFLSLFQDGIKKIARLPVNLEERDFSEKLEKVENYQEIEICISSCRLDVLIAGVFKLSRNQANQLIVKQAVQVNYHLVEKLDYLLQIGDLISVRKYGRLKLVRDNGQTKKDKKKLTVQLLVSK